MGQGFGFVSSPMFGGRGRGDVFDATVRDAPPVSRDTTPLGPGDHR
jgi:hypothetical protein